MAINFGMRLEEKFLFPREKELISKRNTEEGIQSLINIRPQLHNKAASDPERTDTSRLPAILLFLKM